MNSSIERYQSSINDGVEYVIDTELNIPYATLAACERMFPSVSRRTLRRRLKGGALSDVKIAEIVTAGVFKGGALFESESTKIATTGGKQVVSLYSAEVIFDLALEFDLPLARKMGAAGAAVFMLGVAGYRVHAAERSASKPRLTAKEIAYRQKLITARETAVTERDRMCREVQAILDLLTTIKYTNDTLLVEWLYQWGLRNATSIHKYYRVQIKPTYPDNNGVLKHSPVCAANKIAKIFGYQSSVCTKNGSVRTYVLNRCQSLAVPQTV